MVSFLVLYGTGERQTETVAARIAGALDERGHDPTTIDVDDRRRISGGSRETDLSIGVGVQFRLYVLCP